MSALDRLPVLAHGGDRPPADVDPSTGKGPEWGKAAPIGLLVILLLGIATVLPAPVDDPEDQEGAGDL